MEEKNYWKDRLAAMNIEVKSVHRSDDGSAIEGWYTFVYNERPVFTYRYEGERVFEVGYPPLPPYAEEYKYDVRGRYSCMNFSYFIENIEDFVYGTEGNKRLEKKFRELMSRS